MEATAFLPTRLNLPFLRVFWGFVFAGALLAQDAASLTVTVIDPSKAPVPDARMTLVDRQRGRIRSSLTAETGHVTFDSLEPGSYSLTAEREGFDKIQMEQVLIGVRDRQSLRIELRVAAAAATTITVTAQAEGISADPASGIAAENSFMEHLPMNGRSVDSVILMAPGVTSAAGGRGGAGYNANGMRENTNYYTLDGVSVNGAMGGGGMMGGPGGGGMGMSMAGMGGGGPGAGALETSSLESMQEIRVQTSTFAPEFGRTPGAQVSMASRGGTNLLRGSLAYYYRNAGMNANDWFANSAGRGRGALRQDRLGATLGGPIRRDRTFFFASYEGLYLLTPLTVIADVPNLASRRSARPNLRPYLNAFPLPNGPELGSGAAQFRTVISNPSHLGTGSLRLDHQLNSRSTVFVRYSRSLSTGEGRGTEMVTPNVLSQRRSTADTATVGITTAAGPGLVNDLRANFSRSEMNGSSTMDDFGGAVPLTDARVFPSGITSAQGQYSLSISGLAGYSYAGESHSRQQQVNIVESLTKTAGSHQLKVGADLRYITPTYYRKPYSETVMFRSLAGNTDSLLAGVATSASVSTNETAVYPSYINFSFYAQDAYRMSDRATVTYGLRWDVNPAPGVRQGERPFALASSSVAGVTQNEPLYQTRWRDIAPRLGFSFQLDPRPGRETIFRSGFGVFYDLGYGMSAGAFNGAPYSNPRTLSSVSFPLATSDMAAPGLPANRPYGQIVAADKSLQSPKILQYSASIERMLGRGQSLTVGYAGTSGSRLIRMEMQPAFSSAYDMLSLTTNGASSDYNALQVQFRRRLSRTLQAQVGYTWSHSIDSASSDAGFGGGLATLFGSWERGSSDYDIRHNLSVSGSYLLPGPRRGWLGWAAGGWYFDWVASARTGLPFDIQGISASMSNTSSSTSSSSTTSRGVFARVRPDYNGLPVWIADTNVPGGQRLNAKAFTAPSGYAQGNLGRNAIRGFGMSQIDFSLRRQIAVRERWRLNFSAQAFNVTNHPNFANPSAMEGANLSSPTFGIVNRMLNQSMGGNQTYRSGGPRMLELALRLQF